MNDPRKSNGWVLLSLMVLWGYFIYWLVWILGLLLKPTIGG